LNDEWKSDPAAAYNPRKRLLFLIDVYAPKKNRTGFERAIEWDFEFTRGSPAWLAAVELFENEIRERQARRGGSRAR